MSREEAIEAIKEAYGNSEYTDEIIKALEQEPSSSEKPNKSIEEKCPCYHCEYFKIKGWSHCKIHEDAYGDSRCNDYRKANQGSNKVNQGLNKSEIPTGSTTKSETLVSLGVYKQVARERDVAIQQLHELGYEFGQKIEPTTKNDSGVDYISREQALRELKESAEHHANDRREEVLLRRDRDIIRALPSVTPQEPRKGHWDIKDNMWWVCSACGCQTRMMKKYNVPNFCPACGADMRGEEE